MWSLAHLSRQPFSSPVNYQLYARSWEDGSLWLQLNGTNWHRLFELSELPNKVTVLTWTWSSNSHLTEWELLVLPSLCVLGNSKLNYHFLCRLLTGYSQPNDSWNNDLPTLSEGFWDESQLWVLSQTARTWNMTATFDVCLTVHHCDNWRIKTNEMPLIILL